MSRAALLVAPALVACVSSPPDPVGEDTDELDYSYPIDTANEWTPQTGIVNDDEASLVLLLWPPHQSAAGPQAEMVALSGVFVETRRGFVNLGQCVAPLDTTYCATALPQVEDDFVYTEPFDAILLDELLARDVGPAVKLGAYSAPGIQAGALRVYWEKDAGSMPVPGEPLDVTFGPGVWGEVDLPAAIELPTPLEITSPSAQKVHTFTSAEPMELRWNPGGTGDVYLTLATVAESRLYLLEDDGEFDLSFAGLPLLDGDEVNVALSRWTTAELDVDGHELSTQVQYDQWFYGTYRDLGGRIEIEPPDTCAEAGGVEPIAPGGYWGYLSTHANDHNPGNAGCTGWPATGEDAVLPYVLAPYEYLTVTYAMPGDDASVYLLANCANTNSCLDGSDAGMGAVAETVSYFNESETELPISIVLDSYEPNDDVFTLDIESMVLQTDLLVPSCVDALDAGPATAGVYIGDIGNNNNTLDPGAYCGVYAPAGEGLVQVTLQAGETMTATATMNGSDTVLYVLYSCSVAASCASVADAYTTSTETVTYTNASAGSENVYLVVDAADATGQYVVDLQIN